MKLLILPAFCCLFLGGCLYAEGPDGRMAVLDLPVQNQTTVNKTVTVNAPPGTTVIMQETTGDYRTPALPPPASASAPLLPWRLLGLKTVQKSRLCIMMPRFWQAVSAFSNQTNEPFHHETRLSRF